MRLIIPNFSRQSHCILKYCCIFAVPNARPRLSGPGNIWVSPLRRFFYSIGGIPRKRGIAVVGPSQCGSPTDVACRDAMNRVSTFKIPLNDET